MQYYSVMVEMVLKSNSTNTVMYMIGPTWQVIPAALFVEVNGINARSAVFCRIEQSLKLVYINLIGSMEHVSLSFCGLYFASLKIYSLGCYFSISPSLILNGVTIKYKVQGSGCKLAGQNAEEDNYKTLFPC